MPSPLPILLRYAIFAGIWMTGELMFQILFQDRSSLDVSAAFSGGIVFGVPLTIAHALFLKKNDTESPAPASKYRRIPKHPQPRRPPPPQVKGD